MKARVKTTGEIIEISEDCSCIYAENYDKAYDLNELEFLDVKENEPDYWDKLKHQAAIAAMQGILSNTKLMDILGMQKGRELDEMVADLSLKHATTLVNRLKEEEK